MDTNLQKSQARQNFSLQILSSTILCVISFFFIFWIGSFFEVDIFPLENRSTIYTTFDNYIFDKYVDAVIITLLTVLWLSLSIKGKERLISATSYAILASTAILTNSNTLLEVAVFVSISLLISFFVYHHFATKKIIQIQTKLLMSCLSFVVLVIAVSGLIITLLSFSSFQETITNHSTEIFLLFSSFSPALILFLVVGSFFKLLKTKGNRELKTKTRQFQIIPQKIKRKNKFVLMSLFLLLSIFLSLVPHQSFINIENDLVGADTVDYVKWLNSVMEKEQGELMYQAFVVQNSGDRPFSLLVFSAVLTIFPDNSYQVIDHLPIIFSPLLVLTVFFLTRELTSNYTISLLASFLTAISFQPLIGIYGGLYANWLALILGYSSIVFLLRFLKKQRSIDYLAFAVLLVLTMLSHVYTWTFFTLFIGIFLIFTWRLKMFERKRVTLVFLIILASIAFDAGKSIMTDTPFGFERDVSIISTSASFVNLSSIWSNLSQSSLVYMGGLFGNFLILSLCIYWLFRSNLFDIPNIFIAIFLSIAILPILFGGEVIQSRVLYNIPFQIPAAIGLAYLSYQHRCKILVFAVSLWILIMSFQSITNFI